MMGNLLCPSITLQELKQLRLKDPDGTVREHQIPTLDEALQGARDKTILILDQKDVSVAARVKKIEEHQAEAYAMLIVSHRICTPAQRAFGVSDRRRH
jgi:hypothetical protein